MDDISMDYLLSIFFNNSFVRKAVKTWETAKTDNDSYRALRVLQEAFGVYLDDNLENMLFGFFKKRKKFLSIMLGNFTKTLKKPGRRFALKNQLGIELDDTQSDVEIAAKVISQAIIKKFKPLADLRKSIVDDLRQFTVAGEQEALAPDVRLKAVISKNAASFFAKASAGICTDRDVDLFHREDHFHINIIDDDKKKCVGNVQAYIMQHEGHPYLLLRGFNPSTNLLKTVDAGSLCESIISVGRQFVRDNDLAGVLLSEQGGFLALSNRPDVKKYLEKRYGSNIIPISDFKISSFSTIKAAFNIDAPPSKNIPKNLRKRINPDDGYMSMVG